jgi:UTP--glucose-1-phosphate uridylyltransferase
LPAAGLGTRFLPATKAQPKEMLPLVDKPLIQYVVEEAVGAGIENIIIVTGRGKSAIEDHFDVSFELERFLEERGKKEELATVKAISDLIKVSYVRQKEAQGLGHAVGVTEQLVGDEPFAVMLGDDLIDSKVPCIKQMLSVYEKMKAPVLAVMKRRDFELRRDCRRQGRRSPVPDPRHGGEASRRPGAIGSRYYRSIHFDSGHLPAPSRNREGRER